jgi:membrane fusion protein, multidrug efflux system
MAESNGAGRGGEVEDYDRASERGHDRNGAGHDGPRWVDSLADEQEHRPVRFPVDSQVVADPGGTRLTSEGHPAFPKPSKPRRHWIRWIVIGTIAAAVLGAGLYWGVPWVKYELETVSTDDAFVSSHITYVSPRVEGVVTEVMVDQNDRVEPGQLLVKLDREPFEVAEAQARASLEEARANVSQSRAQVRSQIARARAAYYRRLNVQETLRRQVTTLRAQFATIQARQSSRWLAEVEQRRIENLVQRGSATQSELDQRNNTLKVAREEETEAWAAIQETRAQLGLPPDQKDPLSIPKELENEQSTVQSAVSDIASSLAEVGIPFNPKDAAQAQAFEDFLRPQGGKSAGEGLETVVDAAPAVRVAKAAVARAEKQLDDTRLRLRWTDVRSEIAGYVQDRRTNPGSQVQPGQTLLSIRPTYVWVDANYKETQIHHIRIGMPVDLYVDAYPHRVFAARVAGFSPGTGLSQSLLPPENATGNYVKVTQRLPVRIELTEPNPDDTPLFAGLSVVPHVRLKEQPTGPGAGQRLHTFGRLRAPDVGGGPAGSQPRNRADQGRP